MSPFLHDHCESCFRTICQFFEKQCPMTLCPNGCEASMHRCKVEEHKQEICPKSQVDCINVGYGCPVKLKRRQRAAHLTHCPAAVIYCAIERHRKLLPPDERRQISNNTTTTNHQKQIMQHDCSEIDLCLALSDQRRIFTSAKSVLNALEEEERAEATLSPVARECILCKQDPSSQHLHVVGSMDQEHWLSSNATSNKPEKQRNNWPKPPAPFYIKHGLQVGFSADFPPKHSSTSRHQASLVCGQRVRRDQYAQHVRNLHVDIVTSIDGWLLARCPMYMQGCEWVKNRLIPTNNATLHYLTWTDAIGVQMNTHSCMPSTDASALKLTDLPLEILEQVFSKLDSISLRATAATCRRLRQVSLRQLNKHGLVELIWHRNQSGWRASELRWSFSNTFQKIDQWNLLPTSQIGDHLRHCPYVNPVKHQQPMPVLRRLPDLKAKLLNSQ